MPGRHCTFISTHYTAALPGRRERDLGDAVVTTSFGALRCWEDVLGIVAEGLFRDQALGTEREWRTRGVRRAIRSRRSTRAFICGVLLPIRSANRTLHNLALTSFDALVSEIQDDKELEWSIEVAEAAFWGVNPPTSSDESSDSPSDRDALSDGDTSSARVHAASAISPPPDDRSFYIVGGQRWHRAGHLHESG